MHILLPLHFTISSSLKQQSSYAMLLFATVFLASLSVFPSVSYAQLNPAFYTTSCPNLISTVTNTISTLSKQDNVVPPSTLRLIAHDCFVQGCDASILISSTPGNQAERDAPDNRNIPQNAFDAINKAKQAVEAICPGVVSCADILALAARDAVVALGGPTWAVPLGRKDGRVSKASMVTGKLPGALFNVAQLVQNFGAQGLNLEDMVILSGAHTIGFSHCSQFVSRLYGFNHTFNPDPSMEINFMKQLQQKCPRGNGPDNLQPFDQITPFVFDNLYFKDLQAGKGLLFSDQVLFEDASTQALVNSMAESQDQFFRSFGAAMIKMSSIGVKLGNDGEIRKECSTINSANHAPQSSPTISIPGLTPVISIPGITIPGFGPSPPAPASPTFNHTHRNSSP